MVSNVALFLPEPQVTDQLGIALGSVLHAGDIVLLSGDVGAGKTHLARALIASLLAAPEDIPSPTFTLVQTYETRAGPLWHADLYRLSDASEIEELGLSDAFETAICLIEWPDRLGEVPTQALNIHLQEKGGGRQATLSWASGAWAERLEEVSAHV
ncbi:MAG: tRNA (adenosine(37)-N6)-threonylcarbamoyltransferase complex ATPase subunit type 1 TsaE [Pseudomonadota bacterium]